MSHSAIPSRQCALPGSPLDAASAGLDACVHCGFCLQACPTYVTLEDENDSPRGRLVLMRALLEGELAPDDDTVRTHIDRCLGCRGCETACPSGVPYGHLLEATRATMAQYQPSAPVARLVLWIFARPVPLRLALAGARLARATGASKLLARLPGRLGFAGAMLESTRPARLRPSRPGGDGTASVAPDAEAVSESPPGTPAMSRVAVPRERTAVLRGCVMEGLFAHVNDATVRVLRTNGYATVTAPGQRCCGALHAHAGDLDTARALARANVAAFEASGAERVAVNAAGCGAMMKEYGALLADDPAWAMRAARVSAAVRDVSELLADAGPAPTASLPLRVTYDAPCHLQHAQRVIEPPLAVLRAVRDLTVVPLRDADLCCGSAGIYNLVEPGTSDAVLAPKLRNIRESGAAWVVTGNPGCLMQIGAGLLRHAIPARAVHPVELLDAGYRAAAPPAPRAAVGPES